MDKLAEAIANGGADTDLSGSATASWNGTGGGSATVVIAPDEEVGRIRSVKRKLKLDLELAQQYFFGYTPGSTPTDLRGKQLSINENKIFNDDEYEYETIGIHFLAELGRELTLNN